MSRAAAACRDVPAHVKICENNNKPPKCVRMPVAVRAVGPYKRIAKISDQFHTVHGQFQVILRFEKRGSPPSSGCEARTL
jgi:hypothetical protein